MPGPLTSRGGQLMKRGSTLFLKLVILLLAIVVLTWMVVFPRSEGVAANLDLISIYTKPLYYLSLYSLDTIFFSSVSRLLDCWVC